MLVETTPQYMTASPSTLTLGGGRGLWYKDLRDIWSCIIFLVGRLPPSCFSFGFDLKAANLNSNESLLQQEFGLGVTLAGGALHNDGADI